MLIDEHGIGMASFLFMAVAYGFYVLIDYLVRLDKPKPLEPEARRKYKNKIRIKRFWIFVLFGMIWCGSSFLIRRKTIDVYYDLKPGVVADKRYVSIGKLKEVEEVPIDLTDQGNYYVVNKTSHPIVISDVFYKDGAIVHDSTLITVISPGKVGSLYTYPKFWYRPAPERHSESVRGGSIPANGYYLALEIPGVKKGYPDDD